MLTVWAVLDATTDSVLNVIPSNAQGIMWQGLNSGLASCKASTINLLLSLGQMYVCIF